MFTRIFKILTNTLKIEFTATTGKQHHKTKHLRHVDRVWDPLPHTQPGREDTASLQHRPKNGQADGKQQDLTTSPGVDPAIHQNERQSEVRRSPASPKTNEEIDTRIRPDGVGGLHGGHSHQTDQIEAVLLDNTQYLWKHPRHLDEGVCCQTYWCNSLPVDSTDSAEIPCHYRDESRCKQEWTTRESVVAASDGCSQCIFEVKVDTGIGLEQAKATITISSSESWRSRGQGHWGMDTRYDRLQRPRVVPGPEGQDILPLDIK